VALFALALAWVWPAPLAPPSERGPPAASPARPAALAPRLRADSAPLAAAPGRHAAADLAAQPAPARRLADDEAEVCGLGVVRTDEDAPLAQQRIADSVRALALRRLGLALAASRDERQRAAALLLSVRLAVAPAALAAAADADAACRRARDLGLAETAGFCTEEQARSQAALLEPAAAAIDQLARMAALSDDPQVYAYAFEACAPAGLNFHGRDGNCQLVSAERWARLAPDEAEPWLRLAAQALARDDSAAAATALARAAQARTMGSRAGALPALAAAALPDGMPVLERTAALVELAGLDAAAPAAGLDTLDAACADPALHDAARRDTCTALARMLVGRGRSSAAVSAGIQLGERLGWPAEHTGALLRELRAAQDAALRYTAAPQALSCDGLQRRRELLLLNGRLGDLGAGRELLRREGGAGPLALRP
jgi:hypothetical protein